MSTTEDTRPKTLRRRSAVNAVKYWIRISVSTVQHQAGTYLDPQFQVPGSPTDPHESANRLKLPQRLVLCTLQAYLIHSNIVFKRVFYVCQERGLLNSNTHKASENHGLIRAVSQNFE